MSVGRSAISPPQYLSPPVDLYDQPPTEAEFTTQGGLGTGLAQENLESTLLHPVPTPSTLPTDRTPEHKGSSADRGREAFELVTDVLNPVQVNPLGFLPGQQPVVLNLLSPINHIPGGGGGNGGGDGDVQPCCTELTGCLESCRTGVSTGAGQLYHGLEAGITAARDALTSIDCTPCVNGLTQCTDGVGQLMGGVVNLCAPVGQCIAGCFGAVGSALEGCGACCGGLLECVGKLMN